MARRRALTVFSLSFLDAMTCGFGAVVLLYMVINASVSLRSDRLTGDLQAEATRLDREVLEGQRRLVELRNALREVERRQVVARGLSSRLIESLDDLQRELSDDRDTNLARQEHLNRLMADLKSLEEETQRLAASIPREEPQGERLRSFIGDGDRQYLTGLKVGGDRILILVDVSASMLAEKVVDVLVRRNLPDERKLQAGKWRQTVDTVDWLLTQLPPTSRFQVVVFNDSAAPVLEGTDGQWLDGGDADALERVVQGLRRVVPGRGTSLYRAFSVVGAFEPHPDNLVLLTDGLPTQGESIQRSGTISARQRRKLFSQAIKQIPIGLPVNVVLLPMEGDPEAPSAFWRLALSTRGSLLSPPGDWP